MRRREVKPTKFTQDMTEKLVAFGRMMFAEEVI